MHAAHNHVTGLYIVLEVHLVTGNDQHLAAIPAVYPAVVKRVKLLEIIGRDVALKITPAQVNAR